MTTLAAYLDTANTHMERVRAEYARTKAEHASPEKERPARVAITSTVKNPKDECVAGHKMDDDNTYVWADSTGQERRRCRACGRRRNREQRAKNRVASA